VARIKCDFVVIGHGFDPVLLTQALAIPPTRTWREGEQVQRTLQRRKDDGWCLSHGPVESLDLQEVARPLLAMLRPLVRTLVPFVIDRALSASFSYTVAVGDGESVPAIHFNREMLDVVHQLHAEIDVNFVTT